MNTYTSKIHKLKFFLYLNACSFPLQFELISFLYSNLYPSLEKVCLKGTRSESKLAVSAISALANADASEQFIYPQLCKVIHLIFLAYC